MKRIPGYVEIYLQNEKADGSSVFMYIVIIVLIIITLFVMIPHITGSMGSIVDKVPTKLP